jgi:hypothetical protein
MPDQIPNQIIATSKRYKCRHIFLDGHRCGSPSLRREEFCYYHHTTRGAAADLRDRRARMCEFELPPLEDRSSVLAAIAEVLQRIAACAIDNKRAGLLLYGLQIASLNLPGAGDAEHDNQPIEEVIADPRFGDLAPISEISEPATVEAPPTNPGAPCPASGTWVPTPPTQLESESEPVILPNLQASAPSTLPNPHPKLTSSRPERSAVERPLYFASAVAVAFRALNHESGCPLSRLRDMGLNTTPQARGFRKAPAARPIPAWGEAPGTDPHRNRGLKARSIALAPLQPKFTLNSALIER